MTRRLTAPSARGDDRRRRWPPWSWPPGPTRPGSCPAWAWWARRSPTTAPSTCASTPATCAPAQPRGIPLLHPWANRLSRPDLRGRRAVGRPRRRAARCTSTTGCPSTARCWRRRGLAGRGRPGRQHAGAAAGPLRVRRPSPAPALVPVPPRAGGVRRAVGPGPAGHHRGAQHRRTRRARVVRLAPVLRAPGRRPARPGRWRCPTASTSSSTAGACPRANRQARGGVDASCSATAPREVTFDDCYRLAAGRR